MKRKSNKIIVVLVAALTFGSLAATAGHLHHQKKSPHSNSSEKGHHGCFFGEATEGSTVNLTEE